MKRRMARMIGEVLEASGTLCSDGLRVCQRAYRQKASVLQSLKLGVWVRLRSRQEGIGSLGVSALIGQIRSLLRRRFAKDPPVGGFFGEYRFLSNFWPAQVHFEGEAYPTVEHAYQAAKSLDSDIREEIRGVKQPGKAKKLGGRFEVRPDWERIRVGVMRDLVGQKFRVHAELGQRLLATGEAELIEENSWGDTFWGVCEGEGENRLGRILMEVRQELRLSRGR